MCGGATALGQASVALNADGTLNDCTNPATAGSVVTVFVNGFGATTPALATGVIAAAPAVTLAPSMDPGFFTGTTVVATKTAPGAISGVEQVRLHSGGMNTLLSGASLAGVPFRERVILIWIR